MLMDDAFNLADWNAQLKKKPIGNARNLTRFVAALSLKSSRSSTICSHLLPVKLTSELAHSYGHSTNSRRNS